MIGKVHKERPLGQEREWPHELALLFEVKLVNLLSKAQ